MPKRALGKFIDMLELPKEVVFNLPIIQTTGAEDVFVQNYKGLVEYGSEAVRINTGAGQVRFEGAGLVLKHLTSESVTVSGKIKKIEFLG